ncbi:MULTISPECIES: DUF2177 family protein [unclassified Bosea (in: a-proteobacteria)]|uniref:DUF2177 family protein n=1 Tax=unclassified Bosea (in: a-proteobacteria) TaxID=2653178 RepID=UPI000956F890|nr:MULTISPECIES: DUF2177 family protein [unclassified Bosea (in: a-proteobacteria)]TAJ31722.1 MAG: DUF2177 family protein [Bosea sp. (in: a-proteobacteria)]SIQ29446.1 Uncharacterized membrane protein [Bosea sp. TND4EK4]
MRFLAGYIAFLVAFGICDAIWLSTMTAKLYRPALGDLIVEQVRYWPAALFYFGFPLGVVYFALMPALRDGNAGSALLNGALIGLLAYATYDLTNYATLRPWTLTITLADLAYGTLVVGFCTWVAYHAVRVAGQWGWV